MRPSLVTTSKWNWQIANLEQTGAANNVEIIAAPGAGKALYIWKATVGAASTTQTVKVTNGDDASGTRLIHQTIGATFPAAVDFPFEAPLRLTADTALKLSTSTGNCAVVVFYVVGE
jgi:hypothetical protein